jgi:polysaccharide pyruvyl transferase WcaK-like protein
VFGCGIGPLEHKASRKATVEILSNADFAVFRDSLAEQAALDLCGDRKINSRCAIDPAFYCAMLYKQAAAIPDRTRTISINLRKIYQEYGGDDLANRFADFAVEMVKRITDANADHKIYLMPNHYFVVGRDDRSFLNQIKYRLGNREVRVQNRPLSLRETMDVYGSSACCVGMRFHAVVLMAMLNGRCRVVNYTGSQKGKIAGFLADVDRQGYFGPDRMVALDAGEWSLAVFDNMTTDAAFVPDMEHLETAFSAYRHVLTDCLH